MDPSSQYPKKSSIIPAIGAEGGIILVLVVLIGVTFNYFNILPISIPFLPKNQVNNINSNKLTPVYSGVCQFIPKGTKINIEEPDSKVSSALKAYSGVWEGKWAGKTPAVLIVEKITPRIVFGSYVFGSGIRKSAFEIQGNNFSAPPLSWQMTTNNKLLGIYKTSSGSASFIQMMKCKP